MTPRVRAQFGYARACHVAFDAVLTMWRQREAEGWTIDRLAGNIGRSPRWVRYHLSGPARFGMHVLGELAEGMECDLTITVNPLELPLPAPPRTQKSPPTRKIPLDN